MHSRIQYILAFLIVVIVYLVYLVVGDKYRDFKVNTHMEQLQQEIRSIVGEIEQDKAYYASVETNAYVDRIMKSSQNLKNPGEEPIFLVDEKEVADYKKLDTDNIILSEKKVPSKTYGMNNREKWAWYFLNVDVRE